MTSRLTGSLCFCAGLFAAFSSIFTAFDAAALPQAVNETVEVHVLEIEVVVLDPAGAPVHGLRASDFEVQLDGNPATITNFYGVRRGEMREDNEESGSGERTGSQPVLSHLVIFIDDLHLRQSAKHRALEALRSYVEGTLTAGTSVMIVRWNGSLNVTRPARDRDAIEKALSAMQRESALMLRSDLERIRVMRAVDDAIDNRDSPNIAIMKAYAAIQDVMSYAGSQARELEETLDVLGQTVALSSGLPGRRVILFVSEGLEMQAGSDVLAYARKAFRENPIPGFDLEHTAGGQELDDFRFDRSRAFDRVAKSAQAAGVVLSALDPGGLRGYQHLAVADLRPGYGSAGASGTVLRHANESAGMRLLAAETGGRYIGDENDLRGAVAILTDDVSSYYSIGVRPSDKRVVGVKVRLRGHPELRVLATRRRELKSAEEAIASMVRSRLYSRLDENPLHARLVIGIPWPQGGQCLSPVSVVVPIASLTALEDGAHRISVHAIARDERGDETKVHTSTAAVTANDAGEAVYALVFGYRPLRYVMSLAIVDEGSSTTSLLQADIDASICLPVKTEQ